MLEQIHRQLTTGSGKKPRLAIVSTFDELCGIAGYTRFLRKQLDCYFDIEVFDLDQFFMRSTDRHVVKLADRMVKEFCARFKEFDFVNIQLEHGTLGFYHRDILRRFAWLAKSAPALSVTFHTVLAQEGFAFRAFFNKIKSMNFEAAAEMLVEHQIRTTLSNRMFRLLRRLQILKPVNVIVHTPRDKRLMFYVNRIQSVYDHPLAFLSTKDVERFKSEAKRENFPLLAKIPKQAKLIGVFGFVSEYKGFETVIRALQRLPKSYHLLIFGGLHPNDIKARQAISPYVKRLLDEAYVRKTVLDDHDKNSLNVSIDSTNTHLLLDHPRDVSNRLHFMGAQTDEDFARGMGVCDYAVFPYLEVGQSSSGPISIALEMGPRIIAARTRAFLQLARYHKDAFEMFEIGNHVELAHRISTPPAVVCGIQPRAFDAITNTELYIKANSKAGFTLKSRAKSVWGRSEPLQAAE